MYVIVCVCVCVCVLHNINICFFMPPTLKKLRGHIVWACVSVCVSVTKINLQLGLKATKQTENK